MLWINYHFRKKVKKQLRQINEEIFNLTRYVNFLKDSLLDIFQLNKKAFEEQIKVTKRVEMLEYQVKQLIEEKAKNAPTAKPAEGEQQNTEP